MINKSTSSADFNSGVQVWDEELGDFVSADLYDGEDWDTEEEFSGNFDDGYVDEYEELNDKWADDEYYNAANSMRLASARDNWY